MAMSFDPRRFSHQPCKEAAHPGNCWQVWVLLTTYPKSTMDLQPDPFPISITSIWYSSLGTYYNAHLELFYNSLDFNFTRMGTQVIKFHQSQCNPDSTNGLSDTAPFNQLHCEFSLGTKSNQLWCFSYLCSVYSWITRASQILYFHSSWAFSNAEIAWFSSLLMCSLFLL